MNYVANVSASDYWHPCDPKTEKYKGTQIVVHFISDKTIDQLDPERNYDGLFIEINKIVNKVICDRIANGV